MMKDYIFETYFYYLSRNKKSVRRRHLALTYPWRTPHRLAYLRWGCSEITGDEIAYLPYFSSNPYSLLRGVCFVLRMLLANEARYYATREGALTCNKSLAVHDDASILGYQQLSESNRKILEEIEKKKENSVDSQQDNTWREPREEREPLKQEEEYEEYLRHLPPEAVIHEMQFYYREGGKIHVWTASEWAPQKKREGEWETRPCMWRDGEKQNLIRLEAEQAIDPILALINSLQSITRHLVKEAEKLNIIHYYGCREDAENNDMPDDDYNPLKVAWLRHTLKRPAWWGIVPPLYP